MKRVGGRGGEYRWGGDLKVHEEWLSGGEFLWGKFGVAAGLPTEDGYVVEILWRGKDDAHGTVGCVAKPGNEGWVKANRYGCSLQITAKAVNAVGRARERGGGVINDDAYHRVVGTNSVAEGSRKRKRS